MFIYNYRYKKGKLYKNTSSVQRYASFLVTLLLNTLILVQSREATCLTGGNNVLYCTDNRTHTCKLSPSQYNQKC